MHNPAKSIDFALLGIGFRQHSELRHNLSFVEELHVDPEANSRIVLVAALQ